MRQFGQVYVVLVTRNNLGEREIDGQVFVLDVIVVVPGVTKRASPPNPLQLDVGISGAEVLVVDRDFDVAENVVIAQLNECVGFDALPDDIAAKGGHETRQVERGRHVAFKISENVVESI